MFTEERLVLFTSIYVFFFYLPKARSLRTFYVDVSCCRIAQSIQLKGKIGKFFETLSCGVKKLGSIFLSVKQHEQNIGVLKSFCNILRQSLFQIV